MCARICLAPSAQFRPIESGAAWAIEFQNASGVWPDRSRPERSVMVPEIMTGRRTRAFLRHLGDGADRGLGVERVEDGLDQQRVDAALDQAAHLFGVGGAQFVEGDGAEARIGHVGRDRGGAVGRTDGAGDEARTAIFVLRRPVPPGARAARLRG